MAGSPIVIPLLIAVVILLITASINYVIAKNNGLNTSKWFIRGLITPFISLIFLNQEISAKRAKKRAKENASKKSTSQAQPSLKDEDDSHIINKGPSKVGLTNEELDTRKRRKQALLDEIKRKHQPKVTNLEIKTNEDLMNFMNGIWIYENPKNASIFQVFIFNDFTLKVDASFPRFAVSQKDISYTVTLMGNYLRVQDKPQKIIITGRKRVIIGNRTLSKMTKSDHKEIEDLLFTIGSDAELLFGSAVKTKEANKYHTV